jgi:F-type H+-transporting ATPase subunit gamma
MSTSREMRMRIKSIRNLSQVTHALETISASKVRKAIQVVQATQPYAEKAWKVLVHLVRQPGHDNLHPLLTERKKINRVLIILVSSDRGLAGSYDVNIVRETLSFESSLGKEVQYITIGKKGREMLRRRGKYILAEFSDIPVSPNFSDLSSIGMLAVDHFCSGDVDQVFLAYTRFFSKSEQRVMIEKILPLSISPIQQQKIASGQNISNAVFIYEPDERALLDSIIPKFIALQIYQGILSASASEQTARMIAMMNATDNANSLAVSLQLEMNKMRQQSITSELLDIAGGAEALRAKN